MNANEIVKELREACTDNKYAPPMATNKMLTQAADLIESLQNQLAEYENIELTPNNVSEAAAVLGSKGGKAKSEAKAKAAAENGKLGGRPRIEKKAT